MKHIVAWKLKDLSKIDSLIKDINDMDDMTMVESIYASRLLDSSTHDVVLYSTFKELKDLEEYQIHPKHLVFKDKYKDLLTDRVCIDIK